MTFSLEGKLALLGVGLATIAAGLAVASAAWLKSPWIGILLALALIIPLAILSARFFLHPILGSLQAVSDGIVSMRDHDFSVSIAPSSQAELSALVESYNGLGQLLRDE